jgi:hypothetical protein
VYCVSLSYQVGLSVSRAHLYYLEIYHCFECLQNSLDVDFADSLQRIRAKFKATTTLMGVRLPFSLKPSIDQGLTF